MTLGNDVRLGVPHQRKPRVLVRLFVYHDFGGGAIDEYTGENRSPRGRGKFVLHRKESVGGVSCHGEDRGKARGGGGLRPDEERRGLGLF